MENKVYVVCVSKEDPHTETSLLVHCCQCGREIWVSEHNIDKNCVCIHCVVKAMESGTEDVDFRLALPDLIEALKYVIEQNPFLTQ